MFLLQNTASLISLICGEDEEELATWKPEKILDLELIS